MYEYRKRRLAARAGKIEDDGFEDRSFTLPDDRARGARGAAARRSCACATRATISNDVMHRIERELDLEDERLEI